MMILQEVLKHPLFKPIYDELNRRKYNDDEIMAGLLILCLRHADNLNTDYTVNELEEIIELLPYLLIKDKNVNLIMQLRKSKDNIKTSERGGNKGGRSKGKSRLMSSDILAYRDLLYNACKDNNY
jgi:hypothetical protein